jgi:hypothetical protein
MLPSEDKVVIEYQVEAFQLDTCTDRRLYMLHIEKDLWDKRNSKCRLIE